MKKINVERCNELFDVDFEKGFLFWKVSGAGRKMGIAAGSVDNVSRYRRVFVNKKLYLVSRILYAMFHNADPWPLQIDHINKNRSDNSIKNLRTVTHQENHKNRTKMVTNSSNTTGVSWHTQHQKWSSYISIDGKRKHLGYFTTKLAAAYCRHAAELEHNYSND